VKIIMNEHELVIAQYSDSHLFADVNGLHCGTNVYQNLIKVLTNIVHNDAIDVVIFTGDLTQDHSKESYQNFVKAVKSCKLTKPLYYIAGNHDEYELLAHFLVAPPFKQEKVINTKNWQINLINSKSLSPAGWIEELTLQQLAIPLVENQHQMLFMHHHPLNVGYFIDRHALQNQQHFWQALTSNSKVKAIACGHVHRGLHLTKHLKNHQLDVFTCPATSIQFDPNYDDVKALAGEAGRAGYRLFYLSEVGKVKTEICMV